MTAFAQSFLALGVAGWLAACPGGALADAASAWVAGHHSRVRLLAGAATADGILLAGIEITLDRDFKTYWRNPGESGLPPALDWSGSINLQGADLLWPAPSRFKDAGGVSYGYKDRVVLPLRLARTDNTRPVEVRLRLEYGVCNDMCIPAHAELSLALDGDEPANSAIAASLARVPEPKPVGAEGDLAILGLRPNPSEDPASALVPFRAPAGMPVQLFVEAPEGWFAMARERPDPAPEGEPQAASGVFLVEVMERPPAAAGPVELRLTLKAGERAIESTASLDLPIPAR